jgi:hypothetical protein
MAMESKIQDFFKISTQFCPTIMKKGHVKNKS